MADENWGQNDQPYVESNDWGQNDLPFNEETGKVKEAPVASKNSTTMDTIRGLGATAVDTTLDLSRSLYQLPSIANRSGRALEGLITGEEIKKPESITEAALANPGIVSSPIGIGNYLLEQGGDYIADKLSDAGKQLRDVPGAFGAAFKDKDAQLATLGEGFKDTKLPDAMGTVFGKAVRDAAKLKFGDALDDLSDADIGHAMSQLGEGQWKSLGKAARNPAAIIPAIAQAIPSLYIAMRGGTPAMAGLEATGAANDISDYEKTTGKKISDADFVQAVGQTAGINTVLEKFGLESALGKGKGLIKGGLKGGFGEASTEALQQENQNIAALGYNPNQDLSAGVIESAIGGLGSGGPLGAYHGALHGDTPTGEPTIENAARIAPIVGEMAPNPTPNVRPDGRIEPQLVARSEFDDGNLPGIDLPVVPASAVSKDLDAPKQSNQASTEELAAYRKQFDRAELEKLDRPISDFTYDVQTGLPVAPSDKRAAVNTKRLEKAVKQTGQEKAANDVMAEEESTTANEYPVNPDAEEESGHNFTATEAPKVKETEQAKEQPAAPKETAPVATEEKTESDTPIAKVDNTPDAQAQNDVEAVDIGEVKALKPKKTSAVKEPVTKEFAPRIPPASPIVKREKVTAPVQEAPVLPVENAPPATEKFTNQKQDATLKNEPVDDTNVVDINAVHAPVRQLAKRVMAGGTKTPTGSIRSNITKEDFVRAVNAASDLNDHAKYVDATKETQASVNNPDGSTLTVSKVGNDYVADFTPAGGKDNGRQQIQQDGGKPPKIKQAGSIQPDEGGREPVQLRGGQNTGDTAVSGQDTLTTNGTKSERLSDVTEADSGGTGTGRPVVDSGQGTGAGIGTRNSAGVNESGTVPKIPTAPVSSTATDTRPSGEAYGDIDRQSPSKKLDANLEAVKISKALQDEKRAATPQERAVLRSFTGFGGIAEAFPNPATGKYKPALKNAGESLKATLTPEEYNDAKSSTFSAYYTSPVVIGKMYDAVRRLGFTGGKVLEPGSGTGRFIEMLPQDMAGTTKFTAVEMDSVSGNIAKSMHPGHDVRVEDFADTKVPDNSFDMVIGNVPFADISKTYRNQKMSLHDFFFAKSIDKVKEGGIVGLITSRYTMDKRNSGTRKMFGEQVDFVGGVRLPSSAFKGAGTEVVTDMLFFRKRESGMPASGETWMDTVPFNGVDVNAYFDANPQMVLGEMSIGKSQFGREELKVTLPETELAARLDDAIKMLPEFSGATITEIINQNTKAEENAPTIDDVREGSIFVDDKGALQQKIEGAAEPITFMGKPIIAGQGERGKRMAQLVKIRDAARRVLDTQNQDLPTDKKDAARQALNVLYDDFVKNYGAINLTNVRENKNGVESKSMPNMVGFIDDPDAGLVMSLEDYDDETKSATKAAIMEKDVVSPPRAVMDVDNAKDGITVSLNQLGKIDMPFISTIYGKKESEIVAELGNLIYKDPASSEYVTTDEYLSGNVRRKLEIAESEAESSPEYKRNVEALRAVQPEDLLPGQISAALGAPWVSTTDIQDFAAEMFDSGKGSVEVSHSPTEAKWNVQGDWSTKRSVAVTQEYGSDRIDAISLLEDALNMRIPSVYDTVYDSEGKQTRVLNPQKTVEAREKQQKIKDKFTSWIFADQDRAERLVRKYNDEYNNIRLREYDGSHLTLPGMNNAIKLRSHQKDGIWRVVQAGNTFLAHAVGAGKTYTMIGAGMELRRVGLAKKPLFVVPNHMLEQFSREFMQLYPNARILVAPKEGFTAQKRRALTARIATGDWDGVIVTHSSFERMGVSTKYQRKFLQEQIDSYEAAIISAKAAKEAPLSIKNLEKQKKRLEEKIKNQLATGEKDTGLVFDELGIDTAFIDEAHEFKNLQFATKMNNVSGINATGSPTIMDFYMKTRYLQEKTPGRGLIFASGTPVSNSMAEMYTTQRYMQEELLKERNINHFDAWVANFGEVVDVTQLSPNGRNIEIKTKLAKFKNIPELQQMFRTFADVKLSEDLVLPRPKLEGGKAKIVAAPSTDVLDSYIETLLDRMIAIKDRKVEPHEDNALKVTTDGRKAATDMRLVDPEAEDNPASKLNRMINEVYDIWKATAKDKKTQLIFSDYGIDDSGGKFSVYKDTIEKLVAMGVPPQEIAAIGDAKDDKAKGKLFQKVRNGQVRILLGSTAKMGVGTNVQERLYALHHLDAPWRPSDVEQREGRILRQGNNNTEVRVNRYVTERSFDAYMWQTLENKARFINQIMKGEAGVRVADDIDGQELSFAEIKAIASGNPAVMELAKVEADIGRISRLEKSHMDEQFKIRRDLQSLPSQIAMQEKSVSTLEADIKTRKSTKGDDFTMMLGSKKIDSRAEADKLMMALVRVESAKAQQTKKAAVKDIGTIAGFNLKLATDFGVSPDIILQGAGSYSLHVSDSMSIATRLENIPTSLDKRLERVNEELALNQKKLTDLKKREGAPFEYADKLKDLYTEQSDLRDSLKSDAPPPEKKYSIESSTPVYSEKFLEQMDEIKGDILKIAQKMNPAVSVEMVDRLFGEGQALIDSGSSSSEPQEVAGVYTATKRGDTTIRQLVEISLNVSKFNPVETAYHELAHSLEEMQTPEEQALLRATFPGNENMTHDEAFARALASYAMKRHGDKLLPRVRRILDRIMQFLRDMGAMLRGHKILSTADIMRSALSGEMGARTAVTQAEGRKYSHPAQAFHNQDVMNDPRALSDAVAKFSIGNASPDTLLDNAIKYLKNEIDLIRNGPTFDKGIDLNYSNQKFMNPRTIAQAHKGFTPVWNAAVRQFEARDNMAMALGKVLEPYYGLERKTKNKVNAALEIGRLAGENFVPNADGTMSIRNDAFPLAELSKKGDTIVLDKTATDGYLAARAGMDTAIDYYKSLLIVESGLPIDSTNTAQILADAKEGRSVKALAEIDRIMELMDKFDASEADSDANKALNRDISNATERLAREIGQKDANEVRQRIDLYNALTNMDEAKRSGYVPFTRFGNYAVIVKDKDGNVVSRPHFEVSTIPGKSQLDRAWLKKKEVQNAMNALEEKFPSSKGFTISNPVLLNTQAALKTAGVDLTSLDTIAKSSGTDMEYYKGFREEVEKEIQKKGFKKHFIKSNNVPGYSTDFERAIGDYAMSISSYIARRHAMPELNAGAETIDPIKQRKLREYADRYMKYIQNPTEELQRLKNTVFHLQLSGNIGSAAVNALQTPMVTAPYLTAFANKKDVAIELGRAYKDVAKMITRDGLRPTIDPNLAPADVREALKKADADGYMVPTQTLDQMGIATASRSMLLRDRKEFDKVLKAAADVYSSTERLNRFVTYIAAYRLGAMNGMEQKANSVLNKDALWNSQKNEYSPDMFAKYTIDETHFKMGKANRAEMVRGIGGTVFQFKGFSFSMVQLLGRMLKHMGPDGKKAFGIGMLLLFASAGLWGLPFAEDGKEIVEAVWKMIFDEKIDIDKGLRDFIISATDSPTLAEAVSRGPSRLLGVDLSQRVGLGHIIPGIRTMTTVISDEKPDPKIFVGDIFGAAAGRLFGDTYRAFDAYKDGRPWYDVLAQSPVAPAALRNPLMANSWAAHGVPLQDKSSLTPTTSDILLKTIGLTSSGVAGAREEKQFEANAVKAVTDKQARYYKQLSRAIINNDADELTSILSEIERYNEGRDLYQQIIIDKSGLRQKVKAQLTGIDEGKVPMKAREEVQSIREKYIPPQYREITKAIKSGDVTQLKESMQGADRNTVKNAIKDARMPELDRLTNRTPSARAIGVYEGVVNDE